MKFIEVKVGVDPRGLDIPHFINLSSIKYLAPQDDHCFVKFDNEEVLTINESYEEVRRKIVFMIG
ncbi:MAG TPA: hypothetical protein VL947_09735 [Cytophagales bacterium]|nr:hypothetical protein [Cytophagales bacterium]